MTASSKLQREDFIAAAFELARASGVQGFTMRGLGEMMGLDPTTVYRYFKSKDALTVAMVGQMLAERITSEVLALAPKPRIVTIAMITRNVLLENPEMAAALAGATESSDTMAASEIVVEALEELGLTGRQLVRCYQLIEGIVIGMILFDRGGTPAHWESRANRYRSIGVRPFTHVAKSGPEDVEAVATEAMLLGLTTVLDAIEATAS